jgi:hypothetical protein
MDISTLDALLKRSLDNHSSVEQMAREKQTHIQHLNTQLAQANEELARLRGALEFSSLVVKQLSVDADVARQKQAAAKLAAELAAQTARAETEPQG